MMKSIVIPVAFCLSAIINAVSGAESGEQAKPRSTNDTKAASTPWAAGSQAELKRTLLESLDADRLTREEREILLDETRRLFGPDATLEELSALELVRLLDRVFVVAASRGEPPRIGSASRFGPERRSVGDRSAVPEPKAQARSQAAPGFVRRGGRPNQIFGPGPLPSANLFSAPLAQAMHEEETNLNLDEAIRQYRIALDQYELHRRNAAIAVYRMGECLRKKGLAEAARKQHRRILKEFPDQKEQAAMSRKALDELEGD